MNTSSDTSGVSVIVCCFNGANRLAPTLAHLASQRVPAGVGFEVLVIDNASTDDTAEVARRSWPSENPFPLRVIEEAEPGLSNARQRGIQEARFDFVSFVDDDNWVCPDWVGVVHELFSGDPRLGACGGPSEGVYETSPPEWFRRHQGNYAIGEQYDRSSDVTGSPNVLWGAGLSLRKSAWIGIRESGFRPSLSDRNGAGLTSGGDHELCFGMIMGGWKIYYDSRLRLRHYMPSGRITWAYLRKLCRGAGWSSAWIDPYKEELGHQDRAGWAGSVAHLAYALIRNPARLLKCRFSPMEGDPSAATYELILGRLAALLFHKRSISRLRADLQRFRAKSGRPTPDGYRAPGEATACNYTAMASPHSLHQHESPRGRGDRD